MKVNNYIVLILCFCLLLSCQDNMEEIRVETETSNLLDTRSSSNEDPFEQLLGMPLNVKLANSVGPATYLSAKQVSGSNTGGFDSELRVVEKDSGDGLQQWVLHKLIPAEEGVTSFNGHNLYIMNMVGEYNHPKVKNYKWYEIYGGNMRRRDPDGIKTNRFYSFVIKPVKNTINLYSVIPFGADCLYWQGPVEDFDKYRKMYATAATEGSLVKTVYYEGYDPYCSEDLFRWEFTPADIFEIESISYYQMPGDYISLAPDFVSDIIVENKTSLEQSMTANFAQKATIQSKFSETEGFSVTVKTGIGVNLCKIFNGSLDMTTVSSTTSSFENSETKEDSRSYSFPVKVPPFKKVKARVVVQRYNANISYRAVFKGIKTGKRLTLTGKWEGVTASTITYQLIEGENGKVLRSFTGVPTSEIDLTK